MKTAKKRGINTNAVSKIILLLGFAVFFLNCVITDSVILYVHPRIVPVMIFGAIAMIVIAAFLLPDVFRKSEKKTGSLLFFAFPLVIAVTLPAKPLDSSVGSVGSLQILSPGTLGGGKADMQSKLLIMDSDNFYDCINEVYNRLEQYEGTAVEVIGFVLRDSESFADNEFVPARLMMVCCTADMQPIGLLCRYDGASALPSGSWVKVRGTIEKTKFEGGIIPCIFAESVTVVMEPDRPYIYPY